MQQDINECKCEHYLYPNQYTMLLNQCAQESNYLIIEQIVSVLATTNVLSDHAALQVLHTHS